MNLHQLECFLEVAESLSFANAAEVLSISQPAVSRQISSLEGDLGVKLFHRTTRNVSLTSYGHSFLPFARDIHNRMLSAYSNVKYDRDTFVPVLNIGCSNTSDLDFFTLILERCKQQLPELHPYMRVMSHKQLMNLLVQDGLDLVFGFQENFQKTGNLTYTHLFYVDICCAVSASHPFAAKMSVTMEELCLEKAIFCSVTELPAAILGLQRQLEYHYAPSKLYYCDDIPVTLSFIRAGYGYCILPDLQSEHNPGIACIPIEGYEPLSYGIYYKKGSETNPLLKQFINLLEINVKS